MLCLAVHVLSHSVVRNTYTRTTISEGSTLFVFVQFVTGLRQGPAQDVPYDIIIWYVFENHLFIVGTESIINKELELIYQSDHYDRTYVYSYVSEYTKGSILGIKT